MSEYQVQQFVFNYAQPMIGVSQLLLPKLGANRQNHRITNRTNGQGGYGVGDLSQQAGKKVAVIGVFQ